MLLEKLKSCKTEQEVLNTIKSFFEKASKEDYMPVIYNEGYYIGSFNKQKNNESKDNSDIYCKLIIRPYNMKINKTWLKENLSGNFIDGSFLLDKKDSLNFSYDEDSFVYNLIVTQYIDSKEQWIYTFNHNLRDYYIFEKNRNENDKMANLFYVDDGDILPLLKKDGKNIYLYRKAINNYVVDWKEEKINTYPKYILSVEFEYRDGNKYIKTENILGDSFLFRSTSDTDGTTWINGTVDIKIEAQNKKQLKINVVNFGPGNVIRKLNRHNYNDDTETGFVVFNYESIKYLQEQGYIILGMSMINAEDPNKNGAIIDIHENFIVFFEGVFNQLPLKIIEGLQKYNITYKTKALVSSAMFEWQLQANMDYKDYQDPIQRIGDFLLENKKLQVLEYRCSVYRPKNIVDFNTISNSILSILNLTIEDIRPVKSIIEGISVEGYNNIASVLKSNKLLNKKYSLPDLFGHFCVLVLSQVDKDFIIKKVNEHNDKNKK